MRFYEIKPLLREAIDVAVQQADKTLDAIEQTAASNPELGQQALEQLKQIISDLEQTVQPPAEQPASLPGAPVQNNANDMAQVQNNAPQNVIGAQPVAEELAPIALEQELSQAHAEILKLMALAKKPNQKITADKVRQVLSGLQQAGVVAGTQKQAQSEAGFETALSNAINELLDKVFEVLPDLPTKTELKGKKVDPSKKISAAESAKDSTTVRQSATRIVKGIIADLATGVADPVERQALQQKVLAFTTKLKTGIIDMDGVLMDSKSNLDQYVSQDPETLDFYHKVKDELINSMPSTTAGAWGPGELALAVLGKPASKAQGKGDVNVSGRKIEIKTSATDTAGGRIGGSALKQGGSAKGEFHSLLDSFLKSLFGPKVSLTPGTSNYFFKAYDKKGNIKRRDWAGVNIGWFASFNSAISKKRNASAYVGVIQDFLVNLVKIAIVEDAHGVIGTREIKASVNSDGTIDFDKFRQAYILSCFRAYQLKDDVSTIMMLNSTSRSYTLFSNALQLSQLMKKGSVTPSSTIMAFSGQTSLAPQIGIK
jgi:RNase H-fold protein (predicted Holliday junction resolvase)